MAKKTPPTEKQIAYAAEIARICNIEFPTCASQFTKHQFDQFIKQHESNYIYLTSYEDDLEYPAFFGSYDNDAWCEYY